MEIPPEDILMQQLMQNPPATVLRMQELGLETLPQIPEYAKQSVESIVALNISENNFSDITAMLKWVLQFTNLEILITGLDISENSLVELAVLDKLQFVDDMAIEEGHELETVIDLPKYEFLLDKWEPLAESVNSPDKMKYSDLSDMQKSSQVNAVEQDIEPIQMYEQQEPKQEEENKNFTKFVFRSPSDDLELVFEQLPESVKFVVIQTANLQAIPLPPQTNSVEFLNLKGNRLQLDQSVLELELYYQLKHLFIDEDLAEQYVNEIVGMCPELIQLNDQQINEGEMLDENYLPEGENFATEFLEEKIQAQLIDFKNKKSTNEHVAEVLNNLQISTFIGVELDNTAITIELLDMLSEDVLNKIVFLSVQNTQFINSSENLARVIAAMPNLTHLLTSFTGYDQEQFKQFILSEKFKLQLLNDFVVQEAQEIQFKERIDVQQPANNEITERDAEALSLLSELINAEPETDIQENMQVERAKLSKVAQDLTISSPPAQTKQLPKDLRDKIAQETDPLSLKRNSALLPIIYRELYQKPKAQQQKLPHKFIQFELQDVILLRSRVAQTLQQFQFELKQTLKDSNEQVPSLTRILEQKLQELTTQTDMNLIEPVMTVQPEFKPITFEKLSPYNKLAFAVQRLNQNQELMLKNASKVLENGSEYFHRLQSQERIQQLEQSVLALKGGIGELKTLETQINSAQQKVHDVFMKHMSDLKSVQQQLIIIKGQLAVQHGLQKTKITRNLGAGNLQVAGQAKPKLNLMTRQQLIKLFHHALDLHQSFDDFISYFNVDYFNASFGKKFASLKREIFYESLQNNLDHPLVFAIQTVLKQNKVEFYAQNVAELQQVCTDLIIGAVYELDKGATAKDVEKKLDLFRIKGIPFIYWENALQALDENLGKELKEGTMQWDEFIGAVMVWKLAKVEGL
ncbi:Conserved_hypothetical protein [Hexamita inflata]|uniref:Uncharacterized protein n=1 Tax=Hexamita inflata TaxID=28002 RepID=A0AA86UJI4_9EUKA|nr:Conserved hypothetical protein [Hexamita inflata]